MIALLIISVIGLAGLVLTVAGMCRVSADADRRAGQTGTVVAMRGRGSIVDTRA